MRTRIFGTVLWVIVLCAGCKTARVMKVTPDNVAMNTEQRREDYLFIEGHRYKSMNRLGDALECFKQVVALNPSHDVAYYQIGLIEEAMEKPNLAYQSFRKAYNIDKSNDSYLMKTASSALQLNMEDVALPLLQTYVKRKPDNLEVIYLLAEVYVSKQQYENALQQYAQMESIMGVNPSISMERLKIYAIQGDLNKTKQEINGLIRSNPEDSRFPIIAYQLFSAIDQDELALQYLDNALERMPDNGDLLLQKAAYFEVEGDTVAQIGVIKKALLSDQIELDVKLDALQKFFVQVLRKNQSIEESEHLLMTLLEKHPHAASIHELYAALLIEKKEYERAIEQTQMAIDLDPSNFSYWLQEIRLQLQLQRYSDAIKRSEAAKSYHNDNGDLYFWQGIAYSLSNENEQAAQIMLQALDRIPSDNPLQRSEVFAQLGDIYQQMGKRSESFENYEKALEINPRSWIVMNNYAYFLSLRNEDLDKAESMAAKVIASQPNNPTYLDTYAWIFFKKELYSMALFYIKSAMLYGGDQSSVVVEHYGDILYMNDEKEQAMEQWQKALELGSDSKNLDEKIKTRKYIAE